MAASIDVFDSVAVVGTLATTPAVFGKSFRDGSSFSFSLSATTLGATIAFAGQLSADGGATWQTVLSDTAVYAVSPLNYEGPVLPSWTGQLVRLSVSAISGRWWASLSFNAA